MMTATQYLAIFSKTIFDKTQFDLFQETYIKCLINRKIYSVFNFKATDYFCGADIEVENHNFENLNSIFSSELPLK